MTAWLLVIWLGGMAGGPGMVPGIDSEAECRTLADKISAFERFGQSGRVRRFECIKYEARKWP